MARSVEGTAQRRKLLSEIERLAETAVFGTLSETYRTCGRAGCHCQGDGPKDLGRALIFGEIGGAKIGRVWARVRYHSKQVGGVPW